MVILGLNDHVLKAAWPGLVTGKLSDFAGLVFFPLFIEAFGLSRTRAVALTALGFTLVKAWLPANAAWNALFTLVYDLVRPGMSAALHADPTDLVALVALLVPLVVIPRSSS